MFSIIGLIKSVKGYYQAHHCLFAKNYLGFEEKLKNKFIFIFLQKVID